MAVRNEAVRLTLEDAGFSSGMARAAASAALLDRNLNNVDGSHVAVGKSSTGLTRDLNATSRAMDQQGAAIDRFSGRLALIAQAASVLGPALVPLGAATVPVLSALTAGLGAAAGAIGVTVLAANGLGDAFDALNEAQLDRTTENVAAMKSEFERIGPAGEQFVRYIDSLTPVLTDLQMTAREGLFPGVEEGIDALLGRLPEIRNIVSSLSTALGDLATDTGDALASKRFDAFFDYLENDAAPLLTNFGRIAGGVFETFANVLIALDPVTQDFTSGLLEKTRELAKWSRDLGSNESFQGFIDYIRESGPQALAFVGTLVTSLADIAVAVAPVGDVVLPVLTSLLGVLGDIASSDIGTPIFAGVAALAVYNRALATTAALQAKMATSGTLGGLGSMVGIRGLASDADRGSRSLTSLAGAAGRAALPIAGIGLAASGAADGLNLSSTASLTLLGTLGGPWGAALGAAIGLTLDFASANDELEASVKAVQDSSTEDSMKDLLARRQVLIDQLSKDANSLPDVLNRVVGSLSGADQEAGQALLSINDVITARRELNRLDSVDPIEGLNAFFGELNGTILDSTSLMYDFGDALARAMGFLDDRAALRNYEEALDAVRRALKDNGETLDINTAKGRANQETLDRIAESGLAVADSLKGDKRRTFLADLRGELIDAAMEFGRTKERARELVDNLGLLDKKKVEPKVGLDTSDFTPRQAKVAALIRKLDLDQADPRVNLLIGEFLAGNDKALGKLRELSNAKAEPTVTLGDDGFFAAAAGVRQAVGNLDVLSATVDIVANRIGNFSLSPFGSADGSTVPKTGLPYADRHHYLLADGEEVISNRHGQADKHRPLLKAINAGHLADGGTALYGGGGYITLGGSGRRRSNDGIDQNSQLYGINEAFLSVAELGERIASLNANQLRDMARDIDDVNKKGLEKLTKSLTKASEQADKELAKAEERLSEETSALNELRDARKSFADQVSGNFRNDFTGPVDLMSVNGGLLGPGFSAGLQAFIAANPELQLGGVSGDDRRQAYLDSLSASELATLQAQASVGSLNADTRNAGSFAAVLQQLQGMGLNGGAFNELAASGNLSQAQAYASLGPDFIDTLEQSFRDRNDELSNLGKYVGNVRFGADIREQLVETRRATRIQETQLAEVRELRQSSRRVEQRLAAIEKRAERNPKETGQEVGKAIGNAVAAGAGKANK